MVCIILASGIHPGKPFLTPMYWTHQIMCNFLACCRVNSNQSDIISWHRLARGAAHVLLEKGTEPQHMVKKSRAGPVMVARVDQEFRSSVHNDEAEPHQPKKASQWVRTARPKAEHVPCLGNCLSGSWTKIGGRPSKTF